MMLGCEGIDLERQSRFRIEEHDGKAMLRVGPRSLVPKPRTSRQFNKAID